VVKISQKKKKKKKKNLGVIGSLSSVFAHLFGQIVIQGIN
jgi:hypothetical protein